ncbi:MAG: M20/M25/M40 family metallo-hydrolase [Pseudomonadota bacterium]
MINRSTSPRNLACFSSVVIPLMVAFTSVASRADVPDSAAVRSLSRAQLPAAMDAYLEFLRIPNDGHFPEQIMANVRWVDRALTELGFGTRVLTSNDVPHVFAERKVDGARGTILFYLQIDGQPVDGDAWNQANPFEPALKRRTDDAWVELPLNSWRSDFDPEDRIFARSASDSKGPAIALLSALRIMEEQGWMPDYNLKLIADFQEELGSPTLPALVEAERELFAADVMLIMDGTRHLSNLPTLTFGARGLATLTLTVFGATRNLHSGQYGNFAPNPVFALSHLLASMKDEQGRVTIAGYYDGVSLSETERRLLAEVPEDKGDIERSLGIASADAVGSTYQEALQFPSLNVRGLRAAWTGDEVRTLIPRQAVAEIDMRLVPETPADRQLALVVAHIREQGFHIVSDEPTSQEREQHRKLIRVEQRTGSKPFRTPMSSPLGNWLASALTRVYGTGFIKMRTTGGSQPIAPFINTLGVPAISVRIPNPDNNIHAPDENLRLGNFLEGIETCLAILTEPWDATRL